MQQEMEAHLVSIYKDSPGNVELARYMQDIIPVISPGLLQLCKSFLVSRQKIF